MESIIKYLSSNSLILLFLVIAIGYLVGKIKIKGFSLGVSSVLFVGLAFGSLSPDFKLPDFVFLLGLVLFVYTIGLQSGASFFASLNREGLKYNLTVVIALSISGLIAYLFSFIPGMKGNIITGLFCGSLTNTPALATVIELIKADGHATPLKLAEPVIGYSVAYPFGVIGVILGFSLFKFLFRVNLKKEIDSVAINMGLGGEELENELVQVENEKLFGWTIKEIFRAKDLSGIIISRIERNSITEIVNGDTTLQKNDILTLVGTHQVIEEKLHIFGSKINRSNEQNRGQLDYRRIFVSNKEVIGIPLDKLQLHQKFQATITRIKRGDIDFVPTSSTLLQGGDRIRVVAAKNEMKSLAKYFGDSYETISHIDYISISLGIALGLLLGSVPIPLPGGTEFKLGFAAGPLLVALVLGKIERTGNFVWTMSYNANFTLRQMGVVLFLAGIGLKAGYAFGANLQQYGLTLLGLGAVITFTTTSIMMIIGYKILKIPYPLLMGIMSGMQTQPAVLAYSNEVVKNSAPNLGYAMVFPSAMIIKILIVNILFQVLK